MAESQDVLDALLVDMEDRARLFGLSDLALIRETLNDAVADDNRVLEMMARIYPRWFDEPEPPVMPERPRYVSIAVPFDVAHDVVAFSECHCEESVAKGEEETNTQAYKPCLWCACKSSLYRATRHEMYAPDPPESK